MGGPGTVDGREGRSRKGRMGKDGERRRESSERVLLLCRPKHTGTAPNRIGGARPETAGHRYTIWIRIWSQMPPTPGTERCPGGPALNQYGSSRCPHHGSCWSNHDRQSLVNLLGSGQQPKLVRINMRADPGFVNGILEWSKLTYITTNSAIGYWDFPVRQGIQVRHVADLIYRSGRHKYDMSGGGSGCRYWV
jgi:hypothetical protein